MLRLLFLLSCMLSFFCGLAGSARPAFVFNARCRDIYQDVFDFKIQNARLKIVEEKLRDKDNLIVPYLENTADFLEAFVLEEVPVYERYKSNFALRMKMLEGGEGGNGDDVKGHGGVRGEGIRGDGFKGADGFRGADAISPYWWFALGEGHLQMAVVRLKFKEYLMAAYHIRKAYKLLEKNAIAFPGFMPNNKSLGLLHALMGTIPEDYKWLLGLGGMKGTMKQGLEELNGCISAKIPENPDYNLEALLIKVFIELNLQKDKTAAVALADKLCAENKENKHLLLSFVCSNVSMRTGKNDNAIQMLVDRPKKDCMPFYYMDYVTGMAKLNRLDADADVYFKRFIQNFKGKNYIKSALQKLAWQAVILGDVEKYNSYMKILSEKGATDIDEDTQAQKESEEKSLPNVFLLKARLLSDGGYYQRAVSIIAAGTKTYTSMKDQLEVTYRMGRISQEEGNYSKAIEFYSSTVQNGKQYTFYFAANAALQLGLIWEQKKDVRKARFYYQSCLSMKNHDYQHSIDQKAKAGLNRLGN